MKWPVIQPSNSFASWLFFCTFIALLIMTTHLFLFVYKAGWRGLAFNADPVISFVSIGYLASSLMSAPITSPSAALSSAHVYRCVTEAGAFPVHARAPDNSPPPPLVIILASQWGIHTRCKCPELAIQLQCIYIQFIIRKGRRIVFNPNLKSLSSVGGFSHGRSASQLNADSPCVLWTLGSANEENYGWRILALVVLLAFFFFFLTDSVTVSWRGHSRLWGNLPGGSERQSGNKCGDCVFMCLTGFANTWKCERFRLNVWFYSCFVCTSITETQFYGIQKQIPQITGSRPGVSLTRISPQVMIMLLGSVHSSKRLEDMETAVRLHLHHGCHARE